MGTAASQGDKIQGCASAAATGVSKQYWLKTTERIEHETRPAALAVPTLSETNHYFHPLPTQL